jgi:hypothetical protein
MTVSYSYQPWYQKQNFPAWDIPLNTDAGTDDITSVNINSFVMTFHSNAGDTIGTGIFSVKTLNPAEIYYQPSVGDVANIFNGQLIISATEPGGGTVVWDPIPFAITQI